jgi:hypothetical protein
MSPHTQWSHAHNRRRWGRIDGRRCIDDWRPRRRWRWCFHCHGDQIALFIVCELGHNLRGAGELPVVEIPIAIGPPPIAAASPAAPVGIGTPKPPSSAVEMVWVKAMVNARHSRPSVPYRSSVPYRAPVPYRPSVPYRPHWADCRFGCRLLWRRLLRHCRQR